MFTNGLQAEYFAASGALAFDGKGWFWEWPLRWLGLIDTGPIAVVMKTVTRLPRKGNLRWWKPWECVRFIKGGVVNKVGLTNKGIDWWCREIGPRIKKRDIRLIGSIFGIEDELVKMASMLNSFDLAGLEVNSSCPNASHSNETAAVVSSVRRTAKTSRFPVIAKLSVAQDYVAIARELVGAAEAVSINSVPWDFIFPVTKSPLAKLEQRVGGGGGSVSGKVAQPFTWAAVKRLHEKVPHMPVIAPSVWDYGDIVKARALGAKAVSFGAVYLRAPWRPTSFVQREQWERAEWIPKLPHPIHLE